MKMLDAIISVIFFLLFAVAMSYYTMTAMSEEQQLNQIRMEEYYED